MKTYVLWKEQNNYKLQHTKEYIADVCDARKIWTLRDFNTTEEVLQWLKPIGILTERRLTSNVKSRKILQNQQRVLRRD